MVMKHKGLLCHMFLLALLDLDYAQHTLSHSIHVTLTDRQKHYCIDSFSLSVYVKPEKQTTLPDTTTGSLWNDVWETATGIPYWWPVTTQIWIVLLTGWSNFSTNQRHYPDLGGGASSVWNFYCHFSGIILWGNQWLSRELLAVFSGLYL